MSPIISLEASAATGAVPSAGVVGLASENSPHCSAVSALFTLTSKNAAAKSPLGYTDVGNVTAAIATPPGCTKFIGTGSDETTSSAASPVSSEYLRRYWNETPEVLSA